MAEIERWITMNGVHIPIMKGESKARAVSNFIKRRQRIKVLDREDEYSKKYVKYNKKGWNKEHGYLEQDDDAHKRAIEEMKEKYGKNWSKHSDRDIKGYSTDPDRKVKKAQAAYKKTWEDATNDYVKRDEEAYEKIRFKNADREAIMRNYPNRLKSDLEWARAEFAYRQAQNDIEKQKEYKEASLNNAKRSREESSLMAYERALYAPSSRYKLKAKENAAITYRQQKQNLLKHIKSNVSASKYKELSKKVQSDSISIKELEQYLKK